MRIEDRVLDLSAEEGARIVALGLVSEAVDAAEALEEDAGEEPLHDFRVAVRRLRTALRTYRRWLGGAVRQKDARRLRKVAHSTNAARDAEVQLAWLAGRRHAFRSERRRPGWEFLAARYAARTRARRDSARVASRLVRTAEKLRARLGRCEREGDDAGPTTAFGGVLASLARDQAARVADRLGAIRGAADQERAHRARIEVKRLRYLLEPLKGYAPADAREAIAHLKRLHDLLGDLHDAHVLGAELGDAVVDAAAPARGTGAESIRGALRGSPRAGLLALVELVRKRRDALFAELERTWLPGGIEALSNEVGRLVEALEARTRRRGRVLPSPRAHPR